MKLIKGVEIFKAGNHTSSSGSEDGYTLDDLREMSETYNKEVHEAPIVIGHEADQAWDRPLKKASQLANGWVDKVYVGGSSLFADIEVDDEVLSLIRNKKLKKRSIGLYNPESKANPNKGKWSVRHLALLGSEPPAVKSLQDITIYSEGLNYSEFEEAKPEEKPEPTIQMFGQAVPVSEAKTFKIK